MSKPRVLLVEDDSMLRQFACMALEELPLELLEADSVPAAVAQLAAAPVQLIVTDLMMPGESGLDLLERLRQAPHLRGDARVVVLSAGVTADVSAHLKQYDVWRMLLKPVSVRELESCVSEALAGVPVSQDALGPLAGAAPLPAPWRDLSAQQSQALQTYFGGDRRLFEAYLAGCRAQFANDLLAGDQALQRADLAALRHLAHSLKTVLRSLGYSSEASLALSLEDACLAGQQVVVASLWDSLRAQLQALVLAA
jgi:CheY-like chemotaxis protein